MMAIGSARRHIAKKWSVLVSDTVMTVATPGVEDVPSMRNWPEGNDSSEEGFECGFFERVSLISLRHPISYDQSSSL